MPVTLCVQIPEAVQVKLLVPAVFLQNPDPLHVQIVLVVRVHAPEILDADHVPLLRLKATLAIGLKLQVQTLLALQEQLSVMSIGNCPSLLPSTEVLDVVPSKSASGK